MIHKQYPSVLHAPVERHRVQVRMGVTALRDAGNRPTGCSLNTYAPRQPQRRPTPRSSSRAAPVTSSDNEEHGAAPTLCGCELGSTAMDRLLVYLGFCVTFFIAAVALLAASSHHRGWVVVLFVLCGVSVVAGLGDSS